MYFRSLLASAAFLFPGLVGASVTLTFEVDRLKSSTGGDAPNGSLLLLVADTSQDGFDEPSVGDFLGGSDDDIVLSQFEVNNLDGFWSDTTGALAFASNGDSRDGSFSGSWGQGDPFAIVWFPTLTAADYSVGSSKSASVTAGLEFGRFSDAGWDTPVDGTTLSGNSTLVAQSTDSSEPNGTLSPNVLQAGFSVVPEPSTGLLGLLSLSLFFVRRRR